MLILKLVLPSGFEPESTAREAVMIGGYTTGAIKDYPPEETCSIVSVCPSVRTSSIGTGVLLLMTISVSGFRLIFLRRSITVDLGFSWISFVSCVRDMVMVTFIESKPI